MKKIIFIRHGKAEDPVPEFPDFERSLTSKGKEVSRRIALKLKEKENNIGVIITSPAFRAIETALIFSGVYGISAEKIIIINNLYFNIDQDSFMVILKSIKEDINTVALFGHNPSFTDLAELFAKDFGEVLPKSGVICLSFRTKTWSGINRNEGNIDYFLKPKKVL